MSDVENSVKSVLHMESTTMQFGGVVAVNELTLDVNEHKIVAFVGPSGAGKTTTSNCVTGTYQPTFGSVSFDGEVILTDTPQGKMRRLHEGDVTLADLTPVCKILGQVARLGITRTFQNICLSGALTILENVLTAKYMRAKQSVFLVILHLNHAEGERMREESMELPEMQGLARLKDGIASSLPYGLQRRLEIAGVLATSPSLFLLDEPAAGMSPQETQGLTDFIHKIRGDYYLAIFMTEHHMDLVMQISDRIYMLDFDKLIAHGTPDQVQNNSEVTEACLGVSEDTED